MAYSLRDPVMLSLGYGCGLRAGEIVRLRAGDIDSAQMIIRIVQAKGRDRHVMLPEELLLSLRQWWTVRPLLRAACWSAWLPIVSGVAEPAASSPLVRGLFAAARRQHQNARRANVAISLQKDMKP